MDYDFLGIDHLGIVVKDIDQARTTYRDLLGFKVSGEEILDDRGLHICFAETGNSRLELISPTRDDSEVSRFLEKRGEGIHHICIEVRDIEKAVDKMQSNGATFAGKGISIGAHNTRVAFLHPKSTHGVLIELVEK